MADFFDQFTSFISDLGDLLGRGIYAPKDFFESLEDIKNTVNFYLSDYIHPLFIPLLTAMIAIALLHKLMRLGDKE